MKLNSVVLWIIAVIVTLGSAYYQRTTGPTYPVRGKAVIAGEKFKYKLPRSWDAGDAEISIVINNQEVRGMIKYRRFNTGEEWASFPMQREGDELVGYLPHQPPAGKLEYLVAIVGPDENLLLDEDPIVIRFTGVVPMWVLIPHILFMFTAMLMSTRTGLEALFRRKSTLPYAWVTLIILAIGGMILGPLVQKFAFDAYWTGWPFGDDLTDNKTLIGLIFWILAVWRLRKNPENVAWPVAASIILLLVFLVPHSAFGSQLDYKTGEITTGN